MAGGEGTRLRPLTSNQPKPMLPMANIPMMEHVVNLLRQHGFEDIVVTVAFMANAIRTYFGDGSEFGVRMVYATESTPLGTAGSVRNARDELDERFLVISGDVLTDIDLAEVVAFHDKRGGLATLALKAVDNPLEFGIVITREDGSIERFLEKPTWGQVFSDTINTGIYVLEPEIFDFIPEGRPVDFSGESFPAALEAGQAALRLRGRRLLGGRGHARGLPEVPPGHPRPAGAGGHRRASSSGPGCGWARAPRSTRASSHRGSGGDRRQLRRRARGHGSAQYCTLGRNVRIGDNAVLAALGGPRQHLPGLRGADRRQRPRPGLRPPRGRALRGGRGPRRRVLRGRPRRDQGRGEGLPVQDGRGRGHRQLVDRLGVEGGPVPVRPGRRPGPGQRGHQPGAGRPALDGLGLDLREGRHRHHLAGHQPGGPGAQAGHHGRLQRRRGQRRRPRGGHRPGHPVPDHLVGQPGRHHRPAGPRRPRSRWCSASSTRTASTSTRPPSARSSGSTTARTSAGCWPGRSATSASRPASLEYYTAALIDSVDLSNARDADLKLVLDYSFGTTSFVMPNLLAKLEAEVLVVNPYANTASVLDLRPAGQRRPGVRAGARLGRPSRCGARPGGRARGHRRRPGPCR